MYLDLRWMKLKSGLEKREGDKMSDDKKYYYLKLKDNFFDGEEIIVLESMPDGHLYCNILLKLYLRSLKNEGKLMFNDRIPYNSIILSQVVRHPVGVVEKSIAVFKDFGLIEVLDNGAIYMLDVQNYIGKSSTEADRQREYQHRITDEKLLISPECKKSNKKSNSKSTPEIELKKEIDIDIEKEIDNISTKVVSSNKLQPIINKWNSLNLSKIISIKGNRLKLLNARIKDYGETEVLRALDNVNLSGFLKGQNNTSWIITFDWLIKPNNFIKVLEGNYTDKGGNNGGTRQNTGSSSTTDYDFSACTG